MRWENLFADLGGQLAELEAAELTAEVADRTRRELARIRFVDRLRPAAGHPVRLATLGGGQLTGRISGVGADWLLLAEDRGPETLVPLDAICAVAGLGAASAAPGREGVVASRLTLGYALRTIARDRAPVAVALRDGQLLTGTIDRVGADFFELAEHDPQVPRRRGDVRGVRTIPVGGVAFVRRT